VLEELLQKIYEQMDDHSIIIARSCDNAVNQMMVDERGNE
jgi:hypothetical protein